MLLNPTSFQVSHAIDEALARVSADKNRRGIIIERSGDSPLIADEPCIIQIIAGLLLNAINSSPEKGTVSVHVEDDDGFVIVAVEDQGQGIAEEMTDRIFDSVEQKESGSVPGLANCRALVERHNGRLRVRSQIGKGSTFWITIPQHLGHTCPPG